jgi:hypothetical protein
MTAATTTTTPRFRVGSSSRRLVGFGRRPGATSTATTPTAETVSLASTRQNRLAQLRLVAACALADEQHDEPARSGAPPGALPPPKQREPQSPNDTDDARRTAVIVDERVRLQTEQCLERVQHECRAFLVQLPRRPVRERVGVATRGASGKHVRAFGDEPIVVVDVLGHGADLEAAVGARQRAAIIFFQPRRVAYGACLRRLRVRGRHCCGAAVSRAENFGAADPKVACTYPRARARVCVWLWTTTMASMRTTLSYRRDMAVLFCVAR